MPIICFFGPDGSGKSSLALQVALFLKKNGYRTKISWMRGTHSLSYLVTRLMRIHGAFIKSDTPRMVRVPLKLRAIWQLVEFISMLPILIGRFILPCAFGSFVVAERYTPDYIVWTSIVTNDSQYAEKFESRFLLSLAQKAKVKIYVTAGLNELQLRSSENSRFLARQLEFYSSLSRALGAKTVDTTEKNLKQSFLEIESLVRPLMFKSGDNGSNEWKLGLSRM